MSRLSADFLDNSIKQLSHRARQLFIYGTSRVAPICKEQLEQSGIGFVGFVVSDGQMKVNVIDGKKVYYLSEVMAQYENPGFILAVQPVNANAVVDQLKKYGAENYCMPYLSF